jgi:diguanylate cyclase (GGDEF)-like protein
MVTGWAIWGLPVALRLYVCGVIAAAVAVAGWTAALTSWRAHDAVLFGLLAGFAGVVIELSRKSAPPEPAGLIRDVFAAWLLPAAILLPPAYALAAPALTFGLLQFRTRRTIAHRRVFSAATNGLAVAAASALFHALPVNSRDPVLWLGAAAGCGVLWSVCSQAPNLVAIWLSDRTVNARSVLFSRSTLANSVCELAMGVLIAGAVAAWGPVMLLPALPLVVVLQHSFRAVQLDIRTDPLTGLLHAGPWRDETEVQLARARRSNAPLTVGIVHLASGERSHLIHDVALMAAADVLRGSLRAYDLIGRMGDRFVFALPGTPADEAEQVAARLSDSLAVLAGPGQQSAGIAVHLGLAATSAPAQAELFALLTTADAALYQATQAGQRYLCLDASATAEDCREEIAVARLTLGALLKYYRKARGLTQEGLAALIPQSRSTVSDAESGKTDSSYSAEFWQACDDALNANGELIAAHARLAALIARAEALNRAAGQDRRALVKPARRTPPPPAN